MKSSHLATLKYVQAQYEALFMMCGMQSKSVLGLSTVILQFSPVHSMQDLDAAAGLRALQKRVHLVPGAVHEILQAGGISAAVTILCSQPLHADLRDAAVTLLQAVLQRLPAEASSAFL